MKYLRKLVTMGAGALIFFACSHLIHSYTTVKDIGFLLLLAFGIAVGVLLLFDERN